MPHQPNPAMTNTTHRPHTRPSHFQPRQPTDSRSTRTSSDTQTIQRRHVFGADVSHCPCLVIEVLHPERGVYISNVNRFIAIKPDGVQVCKLFTTILITSGWVFLTDET